jgi:hypothetical protein
MIAALFPNRPELHFGQGGLHGDLQCFHYHLDDMHKIFPKIREVMKFQRWIVVKLILEKLVQKLSCITLFGPLKQILADLYSFCKFSHL